MKVLLAMAGLFFSTEDNHQAKLQLTFGEFTTGANEVLTILTGHEYGLGGGKMQC